MLLTLFALGRDDAGHTDIDNRTGRLPARLRIERTASRRKSWPWQEARAITSALNTAMAFSSVFYAGRQPRFIYKAKAPRS